MDMQKRKKFFVNYLIPFLVAYFGSKGVFYLFSFKYSLFSDAFDITKFMIDIGVFALLFFTTLFTLKYFSNNKISNKDVNENT